MYLSNRRISTILVAVNTVITSRAQHYSLFADIYHLTAYHVPASL